MVEKNIGNGFNLERNDGSDSKSEVYLEETFYILSKKHTVFRVRLTENGLSLRKECNGSTKEQTISIKDIIGCRCMRSKRRHTGAASCVCSSLPGPQPLKVVDENSGEQDENDISAYLYIYAYILKQNRRGGKRERTTITLRFRSFDKYDDNNKEAQKWRTAIKCLINKLPLDSTVLPTNDKKLLVLLNPKSGAGKARETFQQRVAPILTEAEVPYDLQVTKHSNYAREFIRQRNVYSWRGIVAVGGDGILFEVINGIFERPDWQQVMEEIPIGIVPSGSGNGLARTICHLYDEPYTPNPVLASALAISKGKDAAMHVVRVETKSQIMFSFLSVGWGLISDIDVESERLRVIGGQRFTVWTLARLIGLRTYKGKVYFQPVTTLPTSPTAKAPRFHLPLQHSLSTSTAIECEECFRLGDECKLCKTNSTINLDSSNIESPSKESRQRLDSWYSATSRKSAYFSSAGSDYMSIAESGKGDGYKEPARVYGPASRLPALTAPVPPDWKCIEGEFIMVHAGYQTHLGEDFLFSPASRLSDGIIWLLVIRGNVTRAQLLAFFLGLGSGAHATGTEQKEGDEGPIQLLAVNAFRIEPSPQPSHPAHLTVDGELVTYGPVQAEVCPVYARVMVPEQ